MGLPENSKVVLKNKFPKGAKNLITDVPGVKVGQLTLEEERRDIHTGVTAIFPHDRNLFREKVMAGVSVINGFGKSVGLMQIEELGTIETPIIMTNTFGVGTALNGMLKYMFRDNEDIGVSTGTVNCIVTECNDGALNDIRGMHLREEHVMEALERAGQEFEEGAAGAGTGMCCMGLKGGIGSASRIINCDGGDYTLGVILMSNFGVAGNLRVDGRLIDPRRPERETREKGSVIIVIGTDLPLSERQLKRVAGRSVVGLSRTGSFLGNSSGDIAIAFSNGNLIPHYSRQKIISVRTLHDNAIDTVFEATAEAVEEAVISSLYHGKTMKGIRNKVVHSLNEFI